MKNKFIVLANIFLMSILFQNSYAQQDVNGWYWLNGQPTGNTLKYVKVFDAANMYAVGSRGTFMKTSDGGDSWSINSQVGSPDNSSTGNLATRDLNTGWFFNANTGYAAGQSLSSYLGVISRTTNGGNSWTYIQYNDTGGTVNGMYFINSNTGYLCGGTRARVHKTTDGGLTWNDISTGLNATNTWNSVMALDTGNVFICTSSKRVYYHKTGLDSAWKVWNLPGSSATITDVYFKDANTGYACGNGNYFAYTLDGGATWTQSNPPSTVGQQRMRYSAGAIYLVGAYTEIYKSVNNGATWSAINFVDGSNVNQPSPFIMYGIDVNGNDIAVVGFNGILNISNDGGSSWRNKNYSVNNNVGATTYSSILVIPTGLNSTAGKIWMGPNGGGDIFYSSNGGTNWTTKPTSHGYSIYGIDFVNSNTGYIAGGNAFQGVGEMSKTTDGGNTWNYLSLSSPLANYQINNIDFVDANTGWAVGTLGPFDPALVTKTTDGGTTWNTQTLQTSPNGSAIKVQMINANVGYVLANTLYSTIDGGTTWTKSTDPYVTSTAWSGMYIMSKDIIYLNGAGTSNLKKIIRTVNGGATWTDLTSNLLSTFAVFKTNWLNLKHGVVCGTNGYMAKTSNGGLNWSESNTGGSTTVGLGLPNKNEWYTISDRNSAYEVWRKYDNLTSISLNVTLGIEGFWNGKPMVTDTVTIQLRNSTAPYAIVDQAREVYNINGFATYEFYTAPAGSYYVVIKHRNGLETWSSAPVAMLAGGNYNYDFTTSASQAFGNNTVLKAGLYCIYSGDVNQDGVIDITDEGLIDNAALNFASGYIATDVNGDGVADLTDLGITDNNSYNLVVVARP